MGNSELIVQPTLRELFNPGSGPYDFISDFDLSAILICAGLDLCRVRFVETRGLSAVPPDQKILEVYQTGPLTVVGFGGHAVLDFIDVTECRDEVTALIAEHPCQSLAFDLTGVKLVPSGLLGLFASLRNLVTEVMIYNPSRDIREVLEVTNLDRLITIYEVEI